MSFIGPYSFYYFQILSIFNKKTYASLTERRSLVIITRRTLSSLSSTIASITRTTRSKARATSGNVNRMNFSSNAIRSNNNIKTSASSRFFSEPFVIYSHPGQVFTKVAYFGAFGQLVFWFNLAHFTWTDLRSKGGALAPPLERFSSSMVSIGLGSIIAYGLHYYTKRRVKSITILPGGVKMNIHTTNIFGKRNFQVRVKGTTCNQRVGEQATLDILKAYEQFKSHSGEAESVGTTATIRDTVKSPTIEATRSLGKKISLFNKDDPMVLKVDGYALGFILDKNGNFHDPKIFNSLFCK